MNLAALEYINELEIEKKGGIDKIVDPVDAVADQTEVVENVVADVQDDAKFDQMLFRLKMLLEYQRKAESVLFCLNNYGDSATLRRLVDPQGNYSRLSTEDLRTGMEGIASRIANTVLNQLRGIRNSIFTTFAGIAGCVDNLTAADMMIKWLKAHPMDDEQYLNKEYNILVRKWSLDKKNIQLCIKNLKYLSANLPKAVSEVAKSEQRLPSELKKCIDVLNSFNFGGYVSYTGETTLPDLTVLNMPTARISEAYGNTFDKFINTAANILQQYKSFNISGMIKDVKQRFEEIERNADELNNDMLFNLKLLKTVIKYTGIYLEYALYNSLVRPLSRLIRYAGYEGDLLSKIHI